MDNKTKIKEYIPRIIDTKIHRYLNLFGAILIEGPKWCGKTCTGEYHAQHVVYVDDMGNIEARSTGDAVITAVTNASIIKNKKNVPLQATCKIKVKPAIELKITTKDEKEVAVGKQLSVKTKWVNGKPKNTGLIWSVRNVDGEAVINEKGVLTGVKSGKVMVKVVSRSDSRLVSVIFLNITDK